MTEGAIERAPMVAAFAAKWSIEALRPRNIAAKPLLRQAGLCNVNFEASQTRVSIPSLSEFLECAAQATSDTAFGLHLAERVDPRDVGLIFYLASAAENLAEAWSLLRDYSQIVDESVCLKLARQHQGVIAEVGFTGLPRTRATQLVELWMGLFIKCSRQVTGRHIRPIHANFEHERSKDLLELERFFGCSVSFGAPPNRLVFSYETLDLPLLTADPRLLRTLRPYCDEAMNVRRTAGTVRAAVECEVRRLLPHGKVRAETVARTLALSVRTMARKLSGEGTTFAATVQQLRHDLALDYLSQEAHPLTQIAWLLGYESSTSFNHAFRRWTSRSPSDVRREEQHRARAPKGCSQKLAAPETSTNMRWAR